MRAIDSHESQILDVLDLVERDGVSYPEALTRVATDSTPEVTAVRLDHLLRVWCAVAGVDVPVDDEEAHETARAEHDRWADETYA